MTNRLEEYMTKPMKRRLGLLSPLCFFGAVLFFPVASGQETYRLEGNRVAVYNLAGRAEIVTGSGNAVEVLVERGGSDAWALQATVTEVGGAEGLVFNYPGDRVVYPAFGREPATENRVRDDGTFLSGAGKGWGRMVELSGSGRPGPTSASAFPRGGRWPSTSSRETWRCGAWRATFTWTWALGALRSGRAEGAWTCRPDLDG